MVMTNEGSINIKETDNAAMPATDLFEPEHAAYIKEMDEYLRRLKSMDKADAQRKAHDNLVKCQILQENGEFTDRYKRDIISKENAIEKVCQILLEEQNEFTELYVSKETVTAGQIKDYFGNKIFEHLPEDVSGWLFFFDMIPFANWGHPCQYLLVVDDDWTERIHCVRGPEDTMELERVRNRV